MKIYEENNNVVLEEVEDFDLNQTLDCGQCFRFYEICEKEFLIIAYERMLRVKQTMKKVILYKTNIEEFESIWFEYFDFQTDYRVIKNMLANKGEFLERAINIKYGIRILRQDLWETLISFIISQNKQIPHIKQVIENMSTRFGKELGEYDNKKYYSFPTPEQLYQATEEEIRACKTGFRAPYIMDAANKVIKGEIILNDVKKMPTSEAKEVLMSIKGVGNKISDCVLLFGLSRTEVFPTDVWIKRIVEHIYLDEGGIENIQNFANKEYGQLAGYAQQYLFYYGRENQIGKK